MAFHCQAICSLSNDQVGLTYIYNASARKVKEVNCMEEKSCTVSCLFNWPAEVSHFTYADISITGHMNDIKMPSTNDDVIKWKYYPRYWPFVLGIHWSPVNSPHKGQWRGALMFSLICAWINGWVNNGEASDLRRYRTHYDVIVMHPIVAFITYNICQVQLELSVNIHVICSSYPW